MKRLVLPSSRNRAEAVIELFSHHGIKFIDFDFLPDLSFDYLLDISDETAAGSRRYSVTWRRARSSSLFHHLTSP
jgi:hypothetical protein